MSAELQARDHPIDPSAHVGHDTNGAGGWQAAEVGTERQRCARTSVDVSSVALRIDVLRQRVAVNVALWHTAPSSATATAAGRGARRARVTNRGGGMWDKRTPELRHKMGSVVGLTSHATATTPPHLAHCPTLPNHATTPHPPLPAHPAHPPTAPLQPRLSRPACGSDVALNDQLHKVVFIMERWLSQPRVLNVRECTVIQY